MDVRYKVAEGTHDTGVSWVVWARRNEPRDGDLLSMIRVMDPSGRIVHAEGSSGPPLDPGHKLSVRTGGSEEGPRALLARVDPAVRRLELRTRDGDTLEVPLFDCADIPEVRFATLLLARELSLDSLTGFDAKGTELERFDLRFQQGRWETYHWAGSRR